MPKRSITALLAALALLIAAPAAFAQTATPTPGGAPKDASEAVKEIYADFRDHGKIDECGHDRADLKDALDTIDPGFDTDNPDFRVGLEAAIQRHDDGKCSEDEGDATPTPTATASPAATASPDDGTLPPATDDGSTDDGGGDDGAIPPAEDGTLPPAGDATPDPGAATPAPGATPLPTVAPAVVPAAPTPSPTPAIVASANGDLLLPAILLGLAALCGAALLAFPFAARRNPRLDAAWQEFRFRTRTTWTDFSDWFRVGR